MSALKTDSESSKNKRNYEQPYKIKLVWQVVIIMGYLHIGAIYGLYLAFTSAKVATTLFTFLLYRMSILGITAGAHRLWSHRAYKAKWPLRLLLMIMFTMALQYSVITWSRNHRSHHKYTDTDADPHSSKRGFFFSHIGWLFVKKHPDVIKKGKEIDSSDLFNDPIVKFQYDHYVEISLIIWLVIPTAISMYFWNETLVNAFHVLSCLRWFVTVHTTALINSFAHVHGNKPYDRNLSATEDVTWSIMTSGEGWHNYHHAFPWDYKASELGQYLTNTTTGFIGFFAWIGWAYDLKTVSPDLVQKRVLRTGDGSHPLWGWDDKEFSKDRKDTICKT